MRFLPTSKAVFPIALLAGLCNLRAAEPTMRAMVPSSGSLVLQQVPTPSPGRGEVRIRVRSAAVNPVDWKMLSGNGGGRSGPPPGGAPPGAGLGGVGRGGPPPGRGPGGGSNSANIPGFDAAGVIDALGDGVDEWNLGDAVIAFSDSRGAYAEYMIAPAVNLVALPETISFEQGAGIPTVAFAAWNMVVDIAKVKAGDKVLVQGGSGGVGSAAVQIAKAREAIVAATASTRNQEFLRSIGVDVPIDYTTERFEEKARGYDVVVNTVEDTDTINRSVAVLKRGGIFASVTGLPSNESCTSAGIRCAGRTGGTPVGEVLRQVVELVKAGKYSINVDQKFPLADANKALEVSKAGRTRGKLILTVSE